MAAKFDKKTGQWSTDAAIAARDARELAEKQAAATAQRDALIKTLLLLSEADLEYVGETVGKALKERAALKAPPVPAAPPVVNPPVEGENTAPPTAEDDWSEK